MKAPAQERSRRTLDRLMTAAVHSFADVGVDRATVAEIVRDAKSSVGSFYGRFSSKDDLVVAVEARLWAEAEERWRSALLDLAGVTADPSSDSVTDLSLPISAAPETSTSELSRAVFDALRPDLEARSRTSAYLERNGFTPASIRVLAQIEAGVLRMLQQAQRGASAAAPGMPQFLTGVVLKTATDPNVGSDAPYHLAHVLSVSLGTPATGTRPQTATHTQSSTDLMVDPPLGQVEEAAPEPAPDADPTSDGLAKPEAFDIWA